MTGSHRTSGAGVAETAGGDDSNRATTLQRVRQPQWIYLGPIAAAPIAHICVSMYRHAKTPMQRRLLLGVGVLGSTVATFAMRVYLIGHAGFPLTGHSAAIANERTPTVKSEEERSRITNPFWGEILHQVLKGFA